LYYVICVTESKIYEAHWCIFALWFYQYLFQKHISNLEQYYLQFYWNNSLCVLVVTRLQT